MPEAPKNASHQPTFPAAITFVNILHSDSSSYHIVIFVRFISSKLINPQKQFDTNKNLTPRLVVFKGSGSYQILSDLLDLEWIQR